MWKTVQQQNSEQWGTLAVQESIFKSVCDKRFISRIYTEISGPTNNIHSNKQGIWHFSNTNTQMSRSTWKTLNILIINQACHETQARQFNTRGHNRTTWNYSKTPSQTNKTALSHHLITVRTAAIKTLTTHTTIHRHMLAKTQKRSLSEKLEATSHVVVATENNMVAFRTLKLHLPCNPKYPEIFPKNRK